MCVEGQGQHKIALEIKLTQTRGLGQHKIWILTMAINATRKYNNLYKKAQELGFDNTRSIWNGQLKQTTLFVNT